MTTALGTAPSGEQRRKLLVGLAGVAVLAVLAVGGLLWAKWLPYAAKASRLGATHAWSGGAMFADAGRAGAAPTFSGAWRFASEYLDSVWRGFLVALAVAAAVDALVPRAWLASLLNRRTRLGQAVAGGVAALPTLMCTCCAAPLAVALRKNGAGTAASLAYWTANPLLNPAVLAFLFLVAPWQFGAVRVVVGVAVVAGGGALAARMLPVRLRSAGDGAAAPAGLPGPAQPEPLQLSQFPLRFGRSLARMAVVLVPLYAVAVLAVGYVSGYLSDFAGLDARLGAVAVLVCAVIGTLLVVPTGGEIPVVLALSAAGLSAGTAGALLITLPAVSLPSILMVGRALSWRATAVMAGVVAVAGLAAAALLRAVA